MISERRQHCDESIASIRKGESAERVEHAWSVGDGREQPIDILFVDTLWEEGDDSKKPSGIRSKFSEHRRGEGKFDRGCKAPGTGGEGQYTQWVHCELIVGSETICPAHTQRVNSGHIQKVPTHLPSPNPGGK